MTVCLSKHAGFDKTLDGRKSDK